MYSMVLMAALTTGTDMPDMGRKGKNGGCCGCYGGMYYGGCYGYGGWGGGYGGCYGGWGGGYGGCHGGYVGWGGCMGRGYAWGGGYGGYSGYAWGGLAPTSGYAVAPLNIGPTFNAPMYAGNIPSGRLGMNQSFYFNPGTANRGSEATIIVHLPADATLSIDGQATQSMAGTRVFTSPPLEAGKTYTYTLQGEVHRDGRWVKTEKTVEVRAGRTSEVTLNFAGTNRDNEQVAPAAPARGFGAPGTAPLTNPRAPPALPQPPTNR